MREKQLASKKANSRRSRERWFYGRKEGTKLRRRKLSSRREG